jgi:hypothetical protein
MVSVVKGTRASALGCDASPIISEEKINRGIREASSNLFCPRTPSIIQPN